MDDEPETPEAELEEPAAGTPPDEGEPAEAEEPEESPDQSPARTAQIAQAEYTRATQTNAAIRKELGLEKGAGQAEVIAALQAIRNGAPSDEADEDVEEVSERERDAIAKARQLEIRVQSAVYGDDFTADAIEVLNLARTSDDIEEMFTAIAAFRDKHGGETSPAATDTDDEPDASGEGDEEPGGLDTSEGDAAPRSTESAPRGRESKVVGALRGLFRDANAARSDRK